jgi:hypothetical protein
MKKTVVTLISLLTLLLITIDGIQFFSLVDANPYRGLGWVPPDPNTIPSKVSIFSPANNSVYSENTIPLYANVTLPYAPRATLGVMLVEIVYKTDWEQNESTLYYNMGFDNSIQTGISLPGHQYFLGSINLTDIPEGTHNITVTSVAEGYYPAENMGYYHFTINGSSSVFFTVDAVIPSVSVLSIENKTYTTNEMALDFAVNEQDVQMAYSLDGQGNVTVNGNSTLTGLSEGTHTITVYATDFANNGVSVTTTFNIAEPFPIMPVTGSIAAVGIVCAGLLVYFKKYRHGVGSV